MTLRRFQPCRHRDPQNTWDADTARVWDVHPETHEITVEWSDGSRERRAADDFKPAPGWENAGRAPSIEVAA